MTSERTPHKMRMHLMGRFVLLGIQAEKDQATIWGADLPDCRYPLERSGILLLRRAGNC